MEIVQLKSGRRVGIRQLGPDDGARLEAAYELLSPESRYRRFMAPKPHLSPSEVRYLVEVDGTEHFALAAVASEDPDRIVAVARFVRLAEEPDAAELAIVVGDPYQGEGLGNLLVRRLALAASERGIRRFRATMLADNGPAHRMVAGVSGGSARRRYVGGAVDELEFELAA